ncbi:hypothetical protein SDJN02_23038, partial [Cucurbita argyrosperma subsp. argyrosperma]
MNELHDVHEKSIEHVVCIARLLALSLALLREETTTAVGTSTYGNSVIETNHGLVKLWLATAPREAFKRQPHQLRSSHPIRFRVASSLQSLPALMVESIAFFSHCLLLQN